MVQQVPSFEACQAAVTQAHPLGKLGMGKERIMVRRGTIIK